MNPGTAPLPMLASIFRGIKTGYHWSFGDAEFLQLNSGRFEEYQAFFRQLNLTLHRDARGFIYATSDEDDDKGGDTITKFVMFAAVWVDALADQGVNLDRHLFGTNHAVADLPHFAAEAHRRQCQQAGILDPNELQNTLRALERLGFVETLAPGNFRLRPAFNRLLDVCSNYRGNGSTDASSPSPP